MPKPDRYQRKILIKAKKTAYFLADTSLPEVLLVVGFVIGRWWKNSDFQYPGEIWMPAILLGLLASAVYYFYTWLFGKGLAAHTAALLLSYSLYSYQLTTQNFLAKVVLDIFSFTTPFGQSLAMLLLLGITCAAIGWLAGWAAGRYQTLRQLQPLKVILFAVVFVFAAQFIRAADRFLDIRPALNYRHPSPALGAAPGAGQKDKPDIYYLLFDRYTSATELKSVYGYDNSDLMGYLASEGFVVRDPAFSNYPFTMSSVASTMSMGYLPQLREKFAGASDWQPAFPYRSVLSDPPIAQVLKSNGYHYNQISSWWDFTRVGIKADSQPTRSFVLSVAGKDFYASDLQRDILNKSILSPWLKKGLTLGSQKIIKYDLDRNPQQNFDSQLSALKQLAGRRDKTVPEFSFAHILAPHPPYVFDANGQTPIYDQESTDNGIDEYVKYTNEMTYVNKRIKELIGYIKHNDPGAVIILQADEGPYPKQFRGPMSPGHYYDPNSLPVEQLRQKMGILASYYLPGANEGDTQKAYASVNIFRTVLNNYLGYNLPLLPDCHFASGNKYQIYDYRDVAQKLTGRPAPPECSQYR